jgi:hypothetical protein
VLVGKEFNTWLAVAPAMRSDKPTHCSFEFYDERGALAARTYELPPNGGLSIDVERELAKELAGVLESEHHVPVWFYLDADRSDINANAVTAHRTTGNTTVEHTF